MVAWRRTCTGRKRRPRVLGQVVPGSVPAEHATPRPGVDARSPTRQAPPAAAAVICLTGCSDTHTSAPADLASVDALRVGLTEWMVVVPRTPVTPGEVRLEVTNVGATAHDLVVTGTRGTWRTPLLDPGRAALSSWRRPTPRSCTWTAGWLDTTAQECMRRSLSPARTEPAP